MKPHLRLVPLDKARYHSRLSEEALREEDAAEQRRYERDRLLLIGALVGFLILWGVWL